MACNRGLYAFLLFCRGRAAHSTCSRGIQAHVLWSLPRACPRCDPTCLSAGEGVLTCCSAGCRGQYSIRTEFLRYPLYLYCLLNVDKQLLTASKQKNAYCSENEHERSTKMKTLIVTIIAAILAISISGCTFVREYHRGHPHHEVIVTSPRPLPPRHRPWPRPYAHRHLSRHRHPRFRRWHD